jgi:hypothetical protein
MTAYDRTASVFPAHTPSHGDQWLVLPDNDLPSPLTIGVALETSQTAPDLAAGGGCRRSGQRTESPALPTGLLMTMTGDHGQARGTGRAGVGTKVPQVGRKRVNSGQ